MRNWRRPWAVQPQPTDHYHPLIVHFITQPYLQPYFQQFHNPPYPTILARLPFSLLLSKGQYQTPPKYMSRASVPKMQTALELWPTLYYTTCIFHQICVRPTIELVT